MAPPPPELMEELVEEVLLRFPPEDPAALAHAALVCKLWCRLVYGAVFRRMFREFHCSAPPLLGLLYNDTCEIRRGDTIRCKKMVVHWRTEIANFVPTTSFRPVHAAGGLYRRRVIDARHGRVLLHRLLSCCSTNYFSVSDPITDEQRYLPKLPYLNGYSWNAAVACAATAGGECDHLDCRRGPFLVVVMDIRYDGMYFSIYSSETGAWSKPTVYERALRYPAAMFNNVPAVLMRSAVYFLVQFNNEIVKYDLGTQEVSMIPLPSKFHHMKGSIVLVIDDDGDLGFVAQGKNKLKIWSRVSGLDADAGFVLSRVIDPRKVLPSDALIKKKPQVNGFMYGGGSLFLFIRTSDGLYSIEINSNQVRKVADCCGDDGIVPYISFCTPTSRLQATWSHGGSHSVDESRSNQNADDEDDDDDYSYHQSDDDECSNCGNYHDEYSGEDNDDKHIGG